jgi:hypothetical protein
VIAGIRAYDGPPDEEGVISKDQWDRWWSSAAATASSPNPAVDADDYFTNQFTQG